MVEDDCITQAFEQVALGRTKRLQNLCAFNEFIKQVLQYLFWSTGQRSAGCLKLEQYKYSLYWLRQIVLAIYFDPICYLGSDSSGLNHQQGSIDKHSKIIYQ